MIGKLTARLSHFVRRRPPVHVESAQQPRVRGIDPDGKSRTNHPKLEAMRKGTNLPDVLLGIVGGYAGLTPELLRMDGQRAPFDVWRLRLGLNLLIADSGSWGKAGWIPGQPKLLLRTNNDALPWIPASIVSLGDDEDSCQVTLKFDPAQAKQISLAVDAEHQLALDFGQRDTQFEIDMSACRNPDTILKEWTRLKLPTQLLVSGRSALPGR